MGRIEEGVELEFAGVADEEEGVGCEKGKVVDFGCGGEGAGVTTWAAPVPDLEEGAWVVDAFFDEEGDEIAGELYTDCAEGIGGWGSGERRGTAETEQGI